MIFEIINMSDEYTIESEEWDVACMAGLIIGKGNYGLQEIDGEREMPMFLFGGLEEWVEAEFGKPLEEFMTSIDKIKIATCLNSILIGDRGDYMQGLGDKTGDEASAYWEEWHDRKRSSLNDIGAYARAYATKLHEMEMEKENA